MPVVVRRAPLADCVVGFFRHNNESIGFEVLIQTFIGRQLRLKAHTVTKVVERKDGFSPKSAIGAEVL